MHLQCASIQLFQTPDGTKTQSEPRKVGKHHLPMPMQQVRARYIAATVVPIRRSAAVCSFCATPKFVDQPRHERCARSRSPNAHHRCRPCRGPRRRSGRTRRPGAAPDGHASHAEPSAQSGRRTGPSAATTACLVCICVMSGYQSTPPHRAAQGKSKDEAPSKPRMTQQHRTTPNNTVRH